MSASNAMAQPSSMRKMLMSRGTRRIACGAAIAAMVLFDQVAAVSVGPEAVSV